VAFANIGGKLTPQFLSRYDTSGGLLIAQTDAASILAYRFHESPITLLLSGDGRSEAVWSGEILPSELGEVRRKTGWQAY
jgi:hypothetical protein